MSDILNIIYNNLMEILATIITGIIGFVGLKLKKLCEEYFQNKTKKEVIKETVNYVEQINKELSCEEKKNEALKKSLEWLKEKKISISDTELEILIESAVKCL